MKKAILKTVFIIIPVLLFITAFPFSSQEGIMPEGLTEESSAIYEEEKIIPSLSEPLPPAGILYCIEDDSIIWSAGENKRVAPASLTKLLTAICALENADGNALFTVGSERNLVLKNSSLCGISEGHRLRLRDLLAGMLIPSGNDAAYTVAANIGKIYSGRADISASKAVEIFCGQMNTVAMRLGAGDSHFENPDGMDSANHYTTPLDMLKIWLEARKYELIKETVAKPGEFVVFDSGESITWKNSNKLIHKDSGFYSENVCGIKTGTTPGAGHCLGAEAEINGKTYVAFVFNCITDDLRYETVINMLDFIKENY